MKFGKKQTDDFFLPCNPGLPAGTVGDVVDADGGDHHIKLLRVRFFQNGQHIFCPMTGLGNQFPGYAEVLTQRASQLSGKRLVLKRNADARRRGIADNEQFEQRAGAVNAGSFPGRLGKPGSHAPDIERLSDEDRRKADGREHIVHGSPARIVRKWIVSESIRNYGVLR